ncbi:MAG: hypothetical protein KDD70_05040 [Bdellovibrionales bacterium]|nr:hypothetical protein [Bdellovibrionales bacterium]
MSIFEGSPNSPVTPPDEVAAEEQYAYVGARSKKIAREAEAPLPPSITELPSLAMLDQRGAAAFCSSTMSWGEDGASFIKRIGELGQSPTVVIKYKTEDALRAQQGEGAFPVHLDDHELILALQRATAVGLLIGGVSQGYSAYHLNTEAQTSVYRINEAPEAASVLSRVAAEDETSLKAGEVEAIFKSSVFVPEDVPFRKDLSAVEFYRYFSEPRTAADVMKCPEFYPGGREAFSHSVRNFVEGHLAYSTDAGLLIRELRPDGGNSYRLSSKGAKYLEDLPTDPSSSASPKVA